MDGHGSRCGANRAQDVIVALQHVDLRVDAPDLVPNVYTVGGLCLAGLPIDQREAFDPDSAILAMDKKPSDGQTVFCGCR